MIDPTDVESGDSIVLEVQTVYQDIESDPYQMEFEVDHIEECEGEDGMPIVDLYLDKYDDNGDSTRRVRFRGKNPEFQQARGSGEEMSWAQFSRDDFCNVRRLEADPATA